MHNFTVALLNPGKFKNDGIKALLAPLR